MQMSIRANFLTVVFPFMTSVIVELQTMCYCNSLLSSGFRHSISGICSHSNMKQLGGRTTLAVTQHPVQPKGVGCAILCIVALRFHLTGNKRAQPTHDKQPTSDYSTRRHSWHFRWILLLLLLHQLLQLTADRGERAEIWQTDLWPAGIVCQKVQSLLLQRFAKRVCLAESFSAEVQWVSFSGKRWWGSHIICKTYTLTQLQTNKNISR